ncbi:MAG: hypothetical protein OCU18_08760 [Candidatus Syntrophoarchaeum sp.]|nr:hypothetical protein [Candidatus Syntrophoarchaeum sp.]
MKQRTMHLIYQSFGAPLVSIEGIVQSSGTDTTSHRFAGGNMIKLFNRSSKKTKFAIDESEQVREKTIAYRNRQRRRHASMIGPSADIYAKLKKFPVGFPADMVEIAHTIDEAWVPTETTIRSLIRDGKWVFVDKKHGIVKRVE